jgi:hypothetical protein
MNHCNTQTGDKNISFMTILERCVMCVMFYVKTKPTLILFSLSSVRWPPLDRSVGSSVGTPNVSDIMIPVTPTPTPRSDSSLSSTHSIHTPTLPTTTILTFTCTQVLWFLVCLTRSRTSGVTTRPVTKLTYYYSYPHNPLYASRLDPSVLAFIFSLIYRHPSICILFNSRFDSFNKPN